MNAITLKNIHKSFHNTKILCDFSIEVKEGEMVAITGGSGSGKTTLLNILGLIEKADQGSVCIFKEENLRPNTKKAEVVIRDSIGYLFQNYALIDNESVEDNLKIGLKYVKPKEKHKKMIKEVLHSVGLEGYEHRKIYELSGGEQQRVAIARVMLKPSKLILADEPTGSLDPQNRDMILSLLDKLHAMGKTIVIVTHDDAVANHCQRKIILTKNN